MTCLYHALLNSFQRLPQFVEDDFDAERQTLGSSPTLPIHPQRFPD